MGRKNPTFCSENGTAEKNNLKYPHDHEIQNLQNIDYALHFVPNGTTVSEIVAEQLKLCSEHINNFVRHSTSVCSPNFQNPRRVPLQKLVAVK